MTRSREPKKKAAAEPARSRRMRPVRELLPQVGGAAFRRFGFVQSSVVSRWSEIVGSRYAAVSAPESIRFPHGRKSGGTLTLIIEGAHAPMLQHVVPTIIERVNRFFGYPAVDRVQFRHGIVRTEKARTKPEPAELRPIPAEMGESLREVSDPELRACLESLARGLVCGEGAPVVTTISVVGRIGDGKK